MDSTIAQKNWEIENNIITVDPSQDQIYYYDAELDKETVSQKPWKNELVKNKLIVIISVS